MTNVPPYMGDFSDEDIAWVIEHGVQRRVLAGDAIILEGEFPSDLYVVLEGSFVVSSSEMALPPAMPSLGPGEILGEISYITGQPPRSTVRAERDSVVLCIPRSELDRKIAEDAGFAARFHKVVSEFAVNRLWQWSPRAAPAPVNELANLRVHELIEKMLRGEFP